MRKEKRTFNEHLIHTLEKTTSEQRMLWLKRAFEFWKELKKIKSQHKRKIKKRNKMAILKYEISAN